MAELNTVTLHLRDIHEFFEAPEFNPYDDPERLEVSGLDYLEEFLNLQGIEPRQLKTTIYLPKEAITADIEAKTRQALAHYCQRKIEQNNSSIMATRREGRRTLPYGLAVAVIALVVMFGLSTLLNFSSALNGVLTGVYTIVAWVSVWHPFEGTFFEWIPDWHNNQIYRKIMEMELSILPEA